MGAEEWLGRLGRRAPGFRASRRAVLDSGTREHRLVVASPLAPVFLLQIWVQVAEMASHLSPTPTEETPCTASACGLPGNEVPVNLPTGCSASHMGSSLALRYADHLRDDEHRVHEVPESEKAHRFVDGQ